MDEFCLGTIVWASARNDIFWPGKVVEISDNVESSKQAVTVNFFIEDSYEDIKNAKKLFQWNCEGQQKFIEKGRGKQPIKRRFNEEDSALYTRLIHPKKSKKGEQHGVVKNNSLENTSVKSKLDEGIERDKSIVNSSHETVPESGETSDEELFKESFSPKKEENKFSVDDIVWAKFYREPYWPAVIKKVNEKTKTNPKKKYVVKFLGWTDCLFKIQPNKLVHFACNAKQRSEFMGMKMGNEELQGMFDKALVQAEDFMNRKGLGKGFEDEKDEEHFQIFEDDDAENGEESDVKKAPNVPPSTSLSECRKSLRARKPVSKYSNILSYIRQAKPILKDILIGTKYSDRHQTYTRGRVSEKNLLKKQSGFGPVGDETLREGIMDLLMDFYREFCGTVDLTYISDVWLPEAIIQSISKMDNVDTELAEEKFRAGFKDAVSYDEVFQLITKLKQRKSTVEKTEEILGCAERDAS
ncbi:uncharacterized protein LOC141885883 isoform X4 [Acropora palmata]|uniref:uncharacterized protein LOC141885883 isoform X4 n=1 Tax=Acropora palmata TaxID=6131 RepID=UPI003DA0CD85